MPGFIAGRAPDCAYQVRWGPKLLEIEGELLKGAHRHGFTVRGVLEMLACRAERVQR